MSSSNGGDGMKPAAAKKDAAKKQMDSDTSADGPSTPTDNWWDGQLKALYQSVLDEPLPDDMMKLVQKPDEKPADAKAKRSRKPEGE